MAGGSQDSRFPAKKDDQIRHRKDLISKVEIERPSPFAPFPVAEAIEASLGAEVFNPLVDLLQITVEPSLVHPGYVVVHTQIRPHHKEL